MLVRIKKDQLWSDLQTARVNWVRSDVSIWALFTSSIRIDGIFDMVSECAIYWWSTALVFECMNYF